MSDHPLRQYREEHELSQEQLGALLGVSRAMVGLIESGARRVSSDDLAEWEAKTGIPREKLRPDIFGTSPPPEPARAT